MGWAGFDREKRMRSLRRIDFSWYFDNPISRPRRKSSSHSLGANVELCRVVPCNPSHAFPCFCPLRLPGAARRAIPLPSTLVTCDLTVRFCACQPASASQVRFAPRRPHNALRHGNAAPFRIAMTMRCDMRVRCCIAIGVASRTHDQTSVP